MTDEAKVHRSINRFLASVMVVSLIMGMIGGEADFLAIMFSVTVFASMFAMNYSIGVEGKPLVLGIAHALLTVFWGLGGSAAGFALYVALEAFRRHYG